MHDITISDHEFGQFQKLIHELAGISLSPAKKALVCGRLAKRLKHHSLKSFGEYFKLLNSGEQPMELQVTVDLLTTNETYFFREPRHFDFLRDKVLANFNQSREFRVWSAACSSGEEPYTIAMVTSEVMGDRSWEIVASDLSTRVLERARNGHYAMERAKNIPRPYLLSYCLKGVGSQDGTFLIEQHLRNRIHFQQINLSTQLPNLGEFDVIFLRNVMIYFDLETKRKVVERVLRCLRRGGHFIIGHSETLNGVCDEVVSVAPSVYRKP